ncbi:MAG: hypothetical protein AB1648_09740 [Pseudomonadota bacterium]
MTRLSTRIATQERMQEWAVPIVSWAGLQAMVATEHTSRFLPCRENSRAMRILARPRQERQRQHRQLCRGQRVLGAAEGYNSGTIAACAGVL